MPFVVDSSVVGGWYIKEQATPYTAAILERLLNGLRQALIGRLQRA